MKTTPSQPDEALQLLEEELRALLPATPSDGLRSRIQHALLNAGEETTAAEPVRPPAPVWFGWIPVAAAAAVALFAVVLTPGIGGKPGGDNTQAAATPTVIDSAAVTPVDWQPLDSNSRLERVDYEGVRQQDSATYRQIRTRYMERRSYKNPKDGSTVEILVPREEVRLVPVTPE